MDNRKYRFSMKFAVERDVIIEAEDLVEAMATMMSVSPEMLLAEIDGTDITFPSNINDQTQVYPEHDFLYRCDDDGEEVDGDLLDDKDEV
jgi:hypothetical protein